MIQKALLKKREEHTVQYTKRQAAREIMREPQVTKVRTTKDKMEITLKRFKPKEVPIKSLKGLETGNYKITIKEVRTEDEDAYTNAYTKGLIVDAKRTDVEFGGCQIHIMGQYDICEGDIKSVMRQARARKDWYATAKITIQILNNWKDRGREMRKQAIKGIIRSTLEVAKKEGKYERKLKELKERRVPPEIIERTIEDMERYETRWKA